jgi:hypothetical protein
MRQRSMIKDGMMKVGRTPCDLCERPAVMLTAIGAYCQTHAPDSDEKRAEAVDNLKTAHDRLADLHTDNK